MNNNIEQLKAEKERWVTRMFWLGVEIAFIFAIPAALGVWLGKRLGGGTMLVITLGIAFVLSWAIVIVRFRQVSAKIKAIESQITQAESKSETTADTSN